MKTYAEHRPTAFDGHLPLDDREDWLVLPLSRTRDSGPFDEANFEAALEILGGESATVEVHRFGHWGPGWYEIILVHPDRLEDAEGIEAMLEQYPILDEDKLSGLESEEETACWNSWINSDLNRTLPEWLDNALDDVGTFHCPEEDAYDKAKQETGEYGYHESGGFYIDVDKLAASYAAHLAVLLDVRKCECWDEEHDWDFTCEACGDRGWVKMDHSGDTQLELPLKEVV